MNGEFWQLPGRKGILAASRQEGYVKKGVRRGPGSREAPRGTQNRPKSLPGSSRGSKKRSREATGDQKMEKFPGNSRSWPETGEKVPKKAPPERKRTGKSAPGARK